MLVVRKPGSPRRMRRAEHGSTSSTSAAVTSSIGTDAGETSVRSVRAMKRSGILHTSDAGHPERIEEVRCVRVVIGQELRPDVVVHLEFALDGDRVADLPSLHLGILNVARKVPASSTATGVSSASVTCRQVTMP